MEPIKVESFDISEYLTHDKAIELYKTKLSTIKESVRDENGKIIQESDCQFMIFLIEGEPDIPLIKKTMGKIFDYLVINGYLDYGILTSCRLECVSFLPPGMDDQGRGGIIDRNGYSVAITSEFSDKSPIKLCEPEQVVKREIFMLYCFSSIIYNQSYFRTFINNMFDREIFCIEGSFPSKPITNDELQELYDKIVLNKI